MKESHSPLLRLTPIAVTAIYVVLSLSALAALTNYVPFWIVVIAVLSPNLFVAWWAWSLRAAAGGHNKKLYYALTILMAFSFGLLVLGRTLDVGTLKAGIMDGIVLITFGAWYLAILWSASAYLVKRESGLPRWHMVAGTFLLVFYLPLGIWLLYRRVKEISP